MTDTSFRQAILACDFWAGLEYMNLVAVPDADERRNVFHVGSDRDLPWVHPDRKSSLKGRGNRYKAQIGYCGPFPKAAYTAALRAKLGAEPIAQRDLGRGDAAALLIPLDDTGRVCGDLFVSSLPWFMGRLNACLAKGASADRVDLRAFELFHEGLMQELRRRLVQLQLVRDAEAPAQERGRREDASAMSSPDGQVRGQPDMLPLATHHVRELLSLIWARCGWCPSGRDEMEDGGRGELLRIKLVTMIRKVTRAVDLGALNSLVATDLMRVRNSLAQGDEVGPALRQYLKLQPPVAQVDLRDGAADAGLGAFVQALSPTRLPAGAWPDFPLVAAQQFAVNMSRSHLAGGGLYGVNGPPGTGKSTLLRDVVADLVVQRADVLVRYDDPLAAFPRKGDIEGYSFGFWELDAALHGHGIVVASSNNGAVENVIKDLPKLTEPLRGAGLRYFTEVSDSIAAGPRDQQRASGATWGLIAALLGSAEKRRAFMSRFWFETEPANGTEPDPQRLRSLRGLVERKEHGAVPWAQAVQAFRQARQQMQERAAALQERVEVVTQAGLLRERIAAQALRLTEAYSAAALAADAQRDAAQAIAAAGLRVSACRQAMAAARAQAKADGAFLEAANAASRYAGKEALDAALDDANAALTAAQRRTALVLAAKPGFLDILFHWSAGRIWREKLSASSDAERAAEDGVQQARRTAREAAAAVAALSRLQAQHLRAKEAAEQAIAQAKRLYLATPFDDEKEQALFAAETLARRQAVLAQERAVAARDQARALARAHAALQAQLEQLDLHLAGLDARLGPLDQAFHDTSNLLRKTDTELQLTVPFDDSLLRGLRVEVFRLAMQVHEAFAVAAWKRLGSTLSAFVDYQSGKLPAAHAGEASVHLWNAFFLVVPVVSSTFASFGRLFAGLGREQIGALLIDEAGQSTPQNAVGAIWRARRVIAVGDPLQLEPVVAQPIEAVTAWRDGVGAHRLWTPPACSTQVLADDTTPFGTSLSLGGEDRKVWVGSPLRVHRRCLDPMFEAANEIAYAGLMVHGVRADPDPSGWVGPSRWFDVRGKGTGHWIPAQGQYALGLLSDLLATPQLRGELKNEQDAWHVNIITPYKEVSTEVVNLLRAEFPEVHDIDRMAGTVHTFQGKEADVVILLLGGDPDRAGAVSFFAGSEQSPNLLNVALTRAKKRIYVVGDWPLWTRNSGTFRRLGEILEQHQENGTQCM